MIYYMPLLFSLYWTKSPSHTWMWRWVKSLSCVQLFATTWTVAYQVPPYMGFSLEWVAISFSRGSSQPRDRTRVSCIAGRCFTVWATRDVKVAGSKIFVFSVHQNCGDSIIWETNEWIDIRQEKKQAINDEMFG